MKEPSKPHNGIVFPDNQQVKAAVDIFVPVASKFTLHYHRSQEPFEELSITLDVLAGYGLNRSFLPMRITIGSADTTDLVDRCIQVLKSGFIRAKGELVTDCVDGQDDKAEHCIHLMDVDWFEAGDPPMDDSGVTGANCYVG